MVFFFVPFGVVCTVYLFHSAGRLVTCEAAAAAAALESGGRDDLLIVSFNTKKSDRESIRSVYFSLFFVVTEE